MSRRLQALERSLGLRLLQPLDAHDEADRGRRTLLRARQELMASSQAFESDMRGDRDQPEGCCAWSRRTPSASSCWSGRWSTTCAAIPRVSVEWLLRDGQPDFIADGIDCAILVGAVADPAVVAIRLTEVPRIVAAAPSVLGAPRSPAHHRTSRPALAGVAHLLPRHDHADPFVGWRAHSICRSARA